MSEPEKTMAVSRRVAVGLGAMMGLFGALKFVEPMSGWYQAQVSLAELPASFLPLGIAVELAVAGLLLAYGLAAPVRVGVAVAGDALLVATMAMAVFVHLHPSVPASVLPLKLKPPVIPLAVGLVAAVHGVQALRRGRPGGRGRSPA